jgi:hypothetical protein
LPPKQTVGKNTQRHPARRRRRRRVGKQVDLGRRRRSKEGRFLFMEP